MIKKIDHIVITTAKIQECISFYEKLGFVHKETVGRHELYAGDFKINVHIKGKELEPKAKNVQTGSVDICFQVEGDIYELKEKLQVKNLTIQEGVVNRNGVKGPMLSIYLRDPDENLVELCQYE